MIAIDEKRASGLRKYFWEYVVLALTAAVIFLFYALSNLNNYIRTDLMQMKIKSEFAIDNNTRVLQEIKVVIDQKVPDRRKAMEVK